MNSNTISADEWFITIKQKPKQIRINRVILEWRILCCYHIVGFLFHSIVGIRKSI